MPFITTPERYGIRKGMLMTIERLLLAKFGEEGVQLLPEIEALDDADKYLLMHDAVFTAANLEEIHRAIGARQLP